MKIAAIDIGTNSVLCCIAEVGQDRSVHVVADRLAITRLGEGFSRTGRISDAAADRTIEAVRSFQEQCAVAHVQHIAVVGTAVLRRADNAVDFVARVQQELKLHLEVISGEHEAMLTYEASARDFGRDIAVVDVGGGSTEVICRSGDQGGHHGELALVSVPIGCVILTEKFYPTVPPTPEHIAAAEQEIHRSFESHVDLAACARPHDRRLIATAGTATTLAAMHLKLSTYDPNRVHGCVLKIDHLRDLIGVLRAKNLAQRRAMPGLMPERADVILAGAEILQEAMSILGYWEVTVSDRGIRWGLLYEMAT